jgi:hypothetical protein
VLACGPFFSTDENATAIALAILLVFKPLAYYAYIQAFRFRVSRPIPMTVRQAARMAVVRTIAGAVLVGGAYAILLAVQSETPLLFSWVYLYGERLIVWWWIGAKMARLVGRRLVGWVLGGTLLNALFDVALVVGVFAGVAGPAVVLAVIAAFIGALHVVGRRDALRRRFIEAPFCTRCEYNLTGNLSGICPECGTPIVVAQEATGPHALIAGE